MLIIRREPPPREIKDGKYTQGETVIERKIKICERKLAGGTNREWFDEEGGVKLTYSTRGPTITWPTGFPLKIIKLP